MVGGWVDRWVGGWVVRRVSYNQSNLSQLTPEAASNDHLHPNHQLHIQLADLEATLNSVPADVIIVASPTDITRVLGALEHPTAVVTYGINPREQGGGAVLAEWLEGFVAGLSSLMAA